MIDAAVRSAGADFVSISPSFSSAGCFGSLSSSFASVLRFSGSVLLAASLLSQPTHVSMRTRLSGDGRLLMSGSTDAAPPLTACTTKLPPVHACVLQQAMRVQIQVTVAHLSQPTTSQSKKPCVTFAVFAGDPRHRTVDVVLCHLERLWQVLLRNHLHEFLRAYDDLMRRGILSAAQHKSPCSPSAMAHQTWLQRSCTLAWAALDASHVGASMR